MDRRSAGCLLKQTGEVPHATSDPHYLILHFALYELMIHSPPSALSWPSLVSQRCCLRRAASQDGEVRQGSGKRNQVLQGGEASQPSSDSGIGS